MATVYLKTLTGSVNWSTGSNWSSGSAPTTGDDVFIDAGSASIDSGLNQSAVTLASLTIRSGFSGTIGLDNTNTSGDYLQIGVTLFTVAQATTASGFSPGGFTRCKIDFGSVTHTTEVATTGNSTESGFGALRLKGGSTTSSLSVLGGSVDLAVRPGETATINNASVGDGTLTLGTGVTFSGTAPKIEQRGGRIILNGSVATINQDAGTLYSFGSGSITTANVNGEARFNHRPSGDAIATLTVMANGSAYFSGDLRQVRFTNKVLLYAGSLLESFNGAQLKLTGPAPFQYQTVKTTTKEVTLEIGYDLTHTVS